MTWDTNWHSYQRLGGLSTHFTAMPANLFISENGLTTSTPDSSVAVIDGELTEYGSSVITGKNDAGTTNVTLQSKAVDGDLYLGFTITHGEWSTYTAIRVWVMKSQVRLVLSICALKKKFTLSRATAVS